MIGITLILSAALGGSVPVGQAAPAHPPRNTVPMPVLGGASPSCSREIVTAVDPRSAGRVQLGTARDGDVAMYRLLERRIDGCSAPIVVNHRVPGSNAIGREMGRDPTSPPR